jgi:hypothetical protein
MCRYSVLSSPANVSPCCGCTVFPGKPVWHRQTTSLGQAVIDLHLFGDFLRQNIPEGDRSSILEKLEE